MDHLAPIAKASSLGLQPGRVYDVSLISLDLAKHTQLIKLYSEGAVGPLIRRFHRLIRHCVLQYGGELWSWAGDGGLCAFTGPRRGDRAVLAGILCLHELAVFNLDPERNDLRHPLRLRIAANDGRLEFREPVQEIFSEVIGDTVKLQEDRARPGELTLTSNLYSQLDDHLKRAFSWEQELDGKPLYVYRGLPARQEPSDFDRDELVATTQREVRQVLERLDGAKTELIDARAADGLFHRLADIYGKIREFRACLERIDSSWSELHLYHLITQTETVLASESTLWQELVHHLPDSGDGRSLPLKLRLLRSATIAHHAETEVELRALVKQLRRRVGLHYGIESPDTGTAVLRKQIDAVVAAAELDQMTELLETLRYYRMELLHFLREGQEHPRRRTFLYLAWRYADLILIEDRSEPASPAQIRTKSLFDQLSTDSTVGPFFAVTRSFLADPREPSRQLIESKLRHAGIVSEPRDVETVLRCILTSHASVNHRYTAARHATPDSLLEIAVYPRSSILSLWIVAQRLLEESASSRLGKIFFDSIKSRLHLVLGAGHDKREVDALRQLISLFFKFDFFVENRYFEDLEAILDRLLETLRSQGLVDEILKLEADRLTLLREQKRFPSDRLPEGVESLPAGLRRHLARNGSYIEIFACDPNDKIAGEVRGYIVEATVSRIATYSKGKKKPVNSSLLGEIEKTNPKLLERFRAAGIGEPSAPGSGRVLHLPRHEVEKIERYRDEFRSRTPRRNPGEDPPRSH